MLSRPEVCCEVVEADSSSKKDGMSVKVGFASINDAWKVSETNKLNVAKVVYGDVFGIGEITDRRSNLGQKKIDF